ncbi:MAG: hypothetical protein ABR968_03585, partial [Bacteroidales bacterium]
MNKWKHITGLIFLWLLFSTGTLLCLFQFVFDYGKVKVVVDYTDYKKEDITIYWATNTSWANGSNWTEENHLTKTTGIGRYSYTFYIRHTDTITCISIDPDEACDSCILHSISVEGIQHPFSCSDFSKNKHYNSSVSQQKDGLKIYRDRDSDDPYVIVPVPANDGAVLYHWKGYEIILIVLVLLFDISVLIFLFRFRFLMTFFQKQQMSKIFFVFAFLLCISMYWTDRVLDFYPQQPNIENRKLVKFPKWKTLINKTESFFIDCTQWCSDYFNFRNMLIEARSMAYLKILNETPMPELVKLGKNNMLFPAFEPCLQDFTGTLQFSEKQLNDICTYTKEKNDVLARDSITFWLILVPLKLTVYFDLLPDYY